MTLTKTEQIIQSLNYNCTSRISHGNTEYRNETFVPAIRLTNLIFASQVNNGQKTQEEIKDYAEQLSLVKYLDNSKSYTGIEELPEEFQVMCENTKTNDETLGRAVSL